MSQANSNRIPDFLSASSPQGLRRLMRLNNAKRGAFHKYDIMFVDGMWLAWFIPYQFTTEEKAAMAKNPLGSGGDNG